METIKQTPEEIPSEEEPSEARKELNELNVKKLAGKINPNELIRLHKLEEQIKEEELNAKE